MLSDVANPAFFVSPVVFSPFSVIFHRNIF